MNNKNKSWLPSPNSWKGTWRDDWRVMGQEGYLLNKHLQYRIFSRELCVEDYDQCAFCWCCFDKNSDNPMKAYFEPIKKHWICEECFNDFSVHFRWSVEEIDE